MCQFYGGTSTYFWWDSDGTRHTVLQGEGCEQGDALAPALFAIGLHNALVEATATLQPGEYLAAFLDDLYLVTRPLRTRAAFDEVTEVVERRAGVQSNLGKCRVYNAQGREAPPGVAELGPEVWRGNRAAEERGLVVLGTPVGTPEFMAAHAARRVAEEHRLLHLLPRLPDLQAAC